MVQADAVMKRKTPSELRGEQLKRRNCKIPMNESVTLLLGAERNSSGVVRGLKKPEILKNPKYIDTRVDDVYPVKKSSDRVRMLYGKEKAKNTFLSSEQTNNTLRNFSTASGLAANNKSQFSCGKGGSPIISEISAACVKDNMEQSTQNIEKCSHNTFRSVTELSLGSEMSSDTRNIDMDKALKGMFARELPGIARSPADSPGRVGDLSFNSPGNFCSEVNIPGHNTPLDLTLKTTMRLISSSSVSWCHRLSTSSAYNGITQFTSQFASTPRSVGHSSRGTPAAEVLYTRALQSWAYPQSSLPPSIIAAMTLSVSRGETDFLLKRQLAWEDSFRCLYYMLRKNMCNIFYFYTPQFVVLFIGGDFLGKRKRSCHAYLSQSTRGLRSLLRENDICFSMPLCRSQVEEATAEDLVELSEIKRNLGQAHDLKINRVKDWEDKRCPSSDSTKSMCFSVGELIDLVGGFKEAVKPIEFADKLTRRLDSMAEVDNSPQSLLTFTGNESVHGLYDFLLNYRSFLSSLTGVDVPLLYSPVPFQNASLCVPEVRCKEVKRVDGILHTLRESHMENGGGIQDASSTICYSIEIKDEILPPWIVCGICAAMGSEEKSFEASFTAEPVSLGLNVALDVVCQKCDSRKDSGNSSLESSDPLGISEAVAASSLRNASLKSLKYSNGSVVASLSPV